MWKWHRSDRDYKQEKLEKTQQVGAPCVPRSQRGHVVEGMIKLLTDGFVLQLLSVELVCQSRGQQEQPARNAGKRRGHRRRTETGKRRQQPKELGKKTKEENRVVVEYQKESKTPTKLPGQKFHLCELSAISRLFSSKQIK